MVNKKIIFAIIMVFVVLVGIVAVTSYSFDNNQAQSKNLVKTPNTYCPNYDDCRNDYCKFLYSGTPKENTNQANNNYNYKENTVNNNYGHNHNNNYCDNYPDCPNYNQKSQQTPNSYAHHGENGHGYRHGRN